VIAHSIFYLLDDIEFDVDNPINSRRKDKGNEKSPDPILKSFLDQGSLLLQHIAAATEEQKKVSDRREKNANFHARLEVAKALNDVEELKRLMEEAKANSLTKE
jgi:hypothetical protein